MNRQVRKVLIDIARRRSVIHYQELCDKCNLNLDMQNNPHDRLIIGEILGEVSIFENSKDRPLISSLCVTRGGFDEGDGFYRLCEGLGKTSDWRKAKKDVAFAAKIIGECHDYWNEDDYYKKHYDDDQL